MKLKAIISTTILSLVISSQTMASENPVEVCSKVSGLAERIADMRYSGVGMAQLMGAVGHDPLARAMVRDAYNLPNFSSSEYQNRAVREFADDVMAECLNAFMR